MNNFKLNAGAFTLGTSTIKIALESLPDNIKIVDAILSVKVQSVTTNSEIPVHYSPIGSSLSSEGWENVDNVTLSADDILKINISDELQDALHKEATHLQLNFGATNITFAIDPESDFINIDYISLAEFQSNGNSHKINLGKSGQASIDLATGKLAVSTPIVHTDSKTLPLSIFSNYHSVENTKIPVDTGIPKNWHLNVNQFLIKENDTDGDLKFTYIDENGKNQIIEEKYYYLTGDEKNPKEYISRENLSVNLDGEYIYNNKEIKTELIAPSGLKLVSSISDVSGSLLVDYEPEELINIRNNIDSLSNNIDSLNSNILKNKEQLIILAISKGYFSKYDSIQDFSKSLNNELLNLEEYYTKLNVFDFSKATYAKEFWDYYGGVIPENLIKAIYAFEGNDKTTESDIKVTGNSSETRYLDQRDCDAIKTLLANYPIIISLGKTFDATSSGSIYSQKINQDKSEELKALFNESSFENLLRNNLGADYFTSETTSTLTKITTQEIKTFFNQHEQISLYYKDIISADIQIKSLKENNQKYSDQIKEYEETLQKLYHQQKLYESQVPVHYLYNDSNVIYGFGKTLDADDNETNTYRLILITDAYENTIFISYDSLTSNRIDSITDSSQKTIKFEYDNSTNYLKEIVDSRERKTSFVFADSLLKEINHNGQKTLFSYDEDYVLQGVLSPAGTGAKFTFTNGQVTEAQAISVIEQVEHNVPTFKSCYQTDASTFIDCLIEEDKINFVYNNYKSTSVSNTKNKTITYLFDKYGKVRSIYENNYTGDGTDFNPEEFSSNVTNFDYQDNNITFKASKLPYSINYLEDVHFDTGNAIVYKETLSLGSLTCGDNCVPYSYPIYANYYSMPDAKKKLSVCLSEDMLSKINDISCSHKTFVLSGWAKADSAFVISDEEVTEFPDYIKNRKFEVRAEITYTDGTTDTSQHQVFDWRNTEWQYCALPITLEDKTVAKMECFIDYSDNTNIDQLVFTDLELKEGDFERLDYNSDNLPIKKSTGHTEWETHYTYDENQKLICETIISKITNKEYSTTYEYNKNGKLIKSTDYNDIIKETVYNDKGSVIKTLTYHKDEPANIICEETFLDEKGQQPHAVNEFGEKLCDYEYIDGTSITSSTIDTKGIKISYGYASDDTLLQTTTTINGEENTNIYGYTLEMLTSLTHNNFDVKYTYDDKCRKTKISIADNEYLSKTYGENEEITTLATGENYKHLFDKNGNVLETYYKANENSDYILIVQNVYDIYGKLLYSKDLTNGENIHTFDYDNFGQVVAEESTQHGVNVSINNEYDDNHSNIDHATIEINGAKIEYDYSYSISPDSKLERITSDLGDENISYDKLGRVNKVELSPLAQEFSYLKKGNYTSNLVSKINFATNNVINDNISYKYDEKGNITEVRQYNKLIARYKYDSLSRIVREDNKEFNTSTTFEYDAGGNILCKKVYAFTIIDNLDFEEPLQNIPYAYPISGWRDQLLSYNDESFEYDNLGNPTKYRDKVLQWSHGRQLDKFSDIATYTYNANGIRTSKTYYTDKSCQCESETNTCTCQDSDCFTTKFFLNGNKIIKQHDCCNDLTFYYGADGLTGFHIKSTNAVYNNENLDHDFFYKKNLQGDIIGIIDSNGNEIVKYVYDAWGNHKALDAKTNETLDISRFESYTNTGNIVQFLAIKNPFRYRSYYYDFETGLYYLNSRYYDPELARFINADDISVLSESKEFINGLNLYSYCNNTPIMHCDQTGAAWWDWLFAALVAVVVIALVVVVTVATAGIGTAIAGALGGGVAATIFGGAIGGAITGAITGAIIGGGISIIDQGLTNGFNNINWNQVGNEVLYGAATGAISGAIFGAAGKALGLLGKTNWAQRTITNLKTSKFASLFGSKSGSFTFFRLGTENGFFRFEASLAHGFHIHMGLTRATIKIARSGLLTGLWNAGSTLLSYLLRNN